MPRSSAPSDLEAKIAEWCRLAARATGGREPQTLRMRSPDGITLDVLCTRLSVAGEEGVPGFAPRIRGGGAAGTLVTAGWEIRQLHALADPAATAAAIREDIGGGARGVWLRLDLASGATARGVRLDSLDALRTATAPLDPARHTLAFDPGPWLLPLGALVLAETRRSGDNGTRLSLGLDPLGAAALGELPSPADALAQTKDVLPSLLAARPKARLLASSGLPFHEAGATAAQELACIVAGAVTLLRFAEGLGIAPEALAERMELRLSTDADLFTGAAKCRALRRLWSTVLGAVGIEARPFLHAVTGRRMLARVDPWTNMLRLTAATAAAVLGGADAVTTLPFDDPLGPPDAFSRRIARNTQAILALESRLFQPVDAVGGSFFLQRLTDDLAREAWALVRRIEASGGMDAALASGTVQEWIARARQERERAVATREELLVGVAAFAELDEERREPAPEVAAAAPARADGPVVDPGHMSADELVGALRAGARLVPPEAREPAIRVLEPFRFAEPFERLRARGEAFRARHGDHPRLVLFCFGPPAVWVPQATFAKNLFEAGGIRTVEQRVAGGREAALAAVSGLDAAFCGICGSLDAALEGELCSRLRARGVRRLYRFGDGGAADYDARPTDGVDALALLADAWSTFGEEGS